MRGCRLVALERGALDPVHGHGQARPLHRPRCGRRFPRMKVSAIQDTTDLFSGDYATARQRFRDYASEAGATLDSLPLDAKGPRGEALTIDIAWLGNRKA